MSLRLRILPRAEADAQHIFDYICERSTQGASAWWVAFEDAAHRAVSDATRFAFAPEDSSTELELRQVLFSTRHGRTYRFIFTIVGDELRILRVRGPGQPPLASDELPSEE
jgi:plasmid stabilization system protein ParE